MKQSLCSDVAAMSAARRIRDSLLRVRNREMRPVPVLGYALRCRVTLLQGRAPPEGS
jgi:hypothetical protein